MRLFEIAETKQFMNALLATDSFRDFELSQAQITTFMTCTIDGLLHRDFYAEDTLPEALRTTEPEEKSEAADRHPGEEQHKGGGKSRLTPWMLAAPMVFAMIRGKNLPLSMKIVLRLQDRNVEHLVQREALPYKASDIKGLFLNISYDQGKVTCTSGSSLAVFSLDRSLDTIWDEAAGKFLGRFTA